MIEVRWSLGAQDDLADIASYYDEIDPDLTDRMLARIVAAPDPLRRHPEAGPEIEMLALRKWRIKRTPYLLIYRLVEGRIEIARVIHSARDWPRLLE